jgi:diguanylate cyclase (GGDEF)-like protein
MLDKPLNDFIQTVGIIAQVSATILIAALFIMLRLPGQRRPYFRFWRLAWACLALALLVLTPQVMAYAGVQYPLSYGSYQMGKLFFFLFLLSGILAYARGFNRRLVWRVGLPLTAVYGAASVLLSSNFGQIMAWQEPAALAAYAWASILLLNLPASRRTLGSRLTGMALLFSALLWLANALHTFGPAAGYAQGPASWLGYFASRYGSFADLILQVLMSFGMVVLLFEDTGRETTEAYKQLAISYRHLERAAYIDPLTGALTRRAFDEGVGMEMAAANYGTVAMLDLDDLKAVNDNWGHETGDGLLRHTVEAMRARLRPLDQVYRWGGDEFTVIMVQTTLAEAWLRLEGLLADIPSYATAAMPAIPVRVSRGTAFFRSAAALRQALSEADRIMLEDKRQRKGGGRGQGRKSTMDEMA